MFEGKWDKDTGVMTYRTLTLPDGAVIKGATEGGIIKEGTYLYTNGNKYTGTFKNNLPHGTGTINYSSGKSWSRPWSGRFMNGKRYLSRISMKCLAEWGLFRTSINGDTLIIDTGDGEVYKGKVGELTFNNIILTSVVKNGKREQYTMDIGGFMKSFVDFEEKFMTFDSFGGKKSFQCY